MINELIFITIFHTVFNLIFIKISFNSKLLDYPNYRKKHPTPIPYTGGMVLSFSYLIIVYLTNTDELANIILSYSFLIALAGFLDDKFQISAGAKIALQIIVIYFVIDKGLFLNNLGVYEHIPYISLGSFSEIFTILCCLFLINSYNYSDGLDGVAISIFILIISAFYFYLKLLGINTLNDIFLMIIAINIISLFFNLSNFKLTKIFLGNSGSNVNGFIISLFAIFLFVKLNVSPSLIIWPLSFLVFEFISVNFIRIRFSKKLLTPGFDHIHYELKEKFKLNNFQVLGLIIVINIYFIIVGWFLFKNIGLDYSIVLFILHFLIYLRLKFYLYKKTS